MKSRMFKLFNIFMILLVFSLSFMGCAGEDSIVHDNLSEKVDEYVIALNELNSNPTVNGTIIIGDEQEIIFNKSYGNADIENGIEFDANTKFRLASVSKFITSIAIMQLVEREMLSLDDTVSKYIPDFNRGDEITIHNLLTHTSGIIRDPIVNLTSYVTKDRLIESFKNRELEFEPGTEWSYSNCNYQALAYILEKITEQSYENYVEKNIFEPAEMTNTGCDISKDDIDNLAVGYVMFNKKLLKAAPVDMSVAFGSGHIYSTAQDMYKLYRSLISEVLISKGSFDKMSQNNTGLEDDFGYGLFIGNIAGHRWIGHGGNLTNGYSTNFVMFPDDNIVIILMTNISFQDTNEIINTIGAILFDKEYILPKKLEAVELELETLQKYEGIYESGDGKRIEIKLIDDQLCVIGDTGNFIVLIPYSDIEFYPEGHQSTRVKMLVNKKGEVQGLISQESSMIIEARKIE